MRLLCRNCLSDQHLLRDCNKISAVKRVQLTQHIFALESMDSDDALNIIQEFNDDRWDECKAILDLEIEEDVREINWSTLSIDPKLPLPDEEYNHTLN